MPLLGRYSLGGFGELSNPAAQLFVRGVVDVEFLGFGEHGVDCGADVVDWIEGRASFGVLEQQFHIGAALPEFAEWFSAHYLVEISGVVVVAQVVQRPRPTDP